MGGSYKPTGKPRGRPRKDGLASGSETALQADKRARQGHPGRKAQAAVRGAAARNGPNAAETSGPAHRVHTVPFALSENSGAEPADLAIAFLETLKIPEGKMAGQRLKLAEFQRQFVRGSLAEGVMVGVLSIGRGNAKTALSAGLSLAALMGIWDNQPKREIIFAARNRDQARTAFQFLVGFIEGLPEDDQELFTIRRGSKLEVEYDGNGGGLARVIAADGKSILGGAPTLALMDERAAWERAKGDDLENAILSGLGKRDGRALIISTSAPDDANTFSRWLDEPPPGCYVQEHRPSFGLPADDLESLLAANPGAPEGIGSSVEWLVAQARRAIARGGSALSSFRNLNRNERVSTEDRSVLITVDEWLAAEVNPDDLPPRDGPCILGVDLGGSRSMSAAAMYWPETGRLEALGTSFPPFRLWPIVAHLMASPGDMLKCRNAANCPSWAKTPCRRARGWPRLCASWTASPRPASVATASDMPSLPRLSTRPGLAGCLSSGGALAGKTAAKISSGSGARSLTGR